MTVTVIVGAQFGDEAKGKITDFLAAKARYVVRTGGGANAGHTIHIPEGTVVLHQLSCGVLRSGVTGISGTGMVIEPFELEKEMEDLRSRGLLRGNILLSERAHVVLPVHRIEDEWEESVRAEKSAHGPAGTTRMGIGPAYADRYGRWGIRLADLTRPALLAERLDLLYSTKGQLKDIPPKEELREKLAEVGTRLSPLIRASEPVLWDASARGESILLEGAQSALLDIDFGTYPYVTSHHPTSAGALIGSGIPPQELDEALGVAKAYCTRVGTGPFPTEVEGEMGDYLRREGAERGATTGRPRRCGWMDLVLLRYVGRLNGFTGWAITKTDVLGGLPEVPVCIHYVTASGETLRDYPPAVAEELEKVQPVFKQVPGWPPVTARVRERIQREGVRAVPGPLRRYLEFIGNETGIPVEYVSYGPQRDETLWLGRSAPAHRRSAVSEWSPA